MFTSIVWVCIPYTLKASNHTSKLQTHLPHHFVWYLGTFGFNQVAIRATRMITSAQPKIGNTHAAHARIAPKTSSGAASGGPGELYASNQQEGSATLVFMAWGAYFIFGPRCYDQLQLLWMELWLWLWFSSLGSCHAPNASIMKLPMQQSNSLSSLEPEFHELIF